MTLQQPHSLPAIRSLIRPLDARWSVRPADDGSVPAGITASWPIDAVVPGCVHQDLLRIDLIPEPFADSNELDVQWVGETDWEFRAEFDLTEAEVAHGRVGIVFDGIDTLASITVNGTHLADTENMHRTYRFDISELVREGGNEMTVVIRSSIVEAQRRREEWGYWPSASFDETYAHIREMAASWGWDWGPKLNASGLWRDVRLEFGGAGRLADVRADPQIDGSDHGLLVVHLDVDAEDSAGELTAEVELTSVTTGRAVLGQATVAASGGLTVVSLDAGQVERWWPVGLGAQPLYEVSVRLFGADGAVVDDWVRRVGFRTIVLDESSDEIGHAFRFIVNDVPVFIRGVNWIPDDPLVSRVDAQRYQERLTDAVELGVNLVRVWGGGVYESDDFYETCDELGLLVWQDFLFACAAYPEDELRQEVEAEARDNIRRLRSHASLAIWTGNNENTWGHVDWGWSEQLDGKPWGEGFYLDLLPGLVAELDPGRAYTQGSPSSGSAEAHPNSAEHGTAHDWEVWNNTDYTAYRRQVPRFVSEFGWQAPPTRATIDEFLSDDPLSSTSPGMLHHQKALDGNGKLDRGLAPFFDVPDEFDAWHWATQLNQARAIRTGVEHYRSHRGRCMGTIWWQFNDCWPVTSWAVLDSQGRRKPAWFALRAAYAPSLIMLQPRGDSLVVVVVNDGTEAWSGRIDVQRRRFDGVSLASTAFDVVVKPQSASTLELPSSLAQPNSIVDEVLVARSEHAAPAFWFFAPDRQLRLVAAAFDIKVSDVDDGATMAEVTAHDFVRDLTMLADHLGDAQVDGPQMSTLFPGESCSFVVHDSDISAERVASSLRSANDLIN